MARKLDKAATTKRPRKGAAAHAARAGADDLAVMHPDAEETIGGRVVAIQEYRFVTGQRVRAKALPFTQSLDAQIKSGSGLVEDMLDVMARHAELVRELMLDAIADANTGTTAEEKAQARAQWREWIEGLDDIAGEALLLKWWDVCGLFFIRQIVRRLDQAQKLNAILAKQPSDGATSTPASPLPATATKSTSGEPAPSAN